MRTQTPLKKRNSPPSPDPREAPSRRSPPPAPPLPSPPQLLGVGATEVRQKRDWECFDNLVSLPTEKGLPPAASGPGAEDPSGPPWITITPQKRRGAPEQPPNQEDKPGAQTLKPEIGKAAKERAQVGAESKAFPSRGCGREQLAGPPAWSVQSPRPGMLAAGCPWPVRGCQGGRGAGGSLR